MGKDLRRWKAFFNRRERELAETGGTDSKQSEGSCSFTIFEVLQYS